MESAALCGSYFIPPSITGQSAVGPVAVIACGSPANFTNSLRIRRMA